VVGCEETYSSGDCYDGSVVLGLDVGIPWREIATYMSKTQSST
jgi:hypothetical protein